MKLIRDKIPAIAAAKGGHMPCHTANPGEFRYHLSKKLEEEVKKFLDSGEPEELADILEVIGAIAKERGLSMQNIYRLRDKKRKKRGGFDERIIWDPDTSSRGE